MGVIAHFATDRGLVKENNEDAGGVFFGGRLLIVADGMGGGKAGEYASQQAVNQVREVIGQAKYYVDGVGLQVYGAGREVGTRGLQMAVQHANTFLYSMARANPSLLGMGTTLVACLIENGRALFANVGDSRGYILRAGVLRQVTRDHSLFSDPKATKSNIITRALGRRSYAEVDCFGEQLAPGDVVFLCSDGLSRVVSDEQIARELSRPSAELPGALAALLALANAHGGPDNISAAAVRVDTLVGERCEGAWQPLPSSLEDDGGSDDSLEQTLVFTPVGPPRSQPVSPTPNEAPVPTTGLPSKAPKQRKGKRLLMIAAAGCAATAALAILLVLPRREPATQLVVFDLIASSNDVGRAVPIHIKIREETLWAADVVVGGSEGWRLVVRYPSGLAATAVPTTENFVQARVPAEGLPLASIELGDGLVSVAFTGMNKIPMSQTWQAGQGGYRVSLMTSAAVAAANQVWNKVLDGAWPEAGTALEHLLKGAPPAAAAAERRRFEELRNAWELARRLGWELRLAADATDSDGLLRVPARVEEYKRAVSQLDRLRPPGVAGLSDNGDALRLAPPWAAIERRLRLARELQEAIEAAKSAESGGRFRADSVAHLRTILERTGVTPTGSVAEILRRAAQGGTSLGSGGARQMSTVAESHPSVVAPTPTLVNSEDRWRNVRELANELEQLRRQLPREELQRRRSDPSLRREVGAIRERAVKILALALQGERRELLPAEVRAAIGEFVKLESHLASYSGCSLKPHEEALAMLREIASIPGPHEKKAQNTLAFYRGECQ